MSSKAETPTTIHEPVDMSRTAVTARLEEVGALYKLAMSLLDICMEHARPVIGRAGEQR